LSAPSGAAAPIPSVFPPAPASSFEGVVHFVQEVNGKPHKNVLSVSGRRMRLDTEGSPSYRLAELDGWEVMDVVDKTRVIHVWETGHSTTQWDEAAITKTGVTKTAAGRPCEVWKLDNAVQKVEACVDATVPGFLVFSGYAGSRGSMQLGGGPLPLLVDPLPNSPQKSPLHVTSIESKKIPALRLLPPAGYQRAPIRWIHDGDDVRRPLPAPSADTSSSPRPRPAPSATP
jgi:hypothetical protein